MPSATTSERFMRLLVLDTIHGGGVITLALREQGYSVDCVDVYRGEDGITPDAALKHQYSCCIAPVHLDPDYPLLHAGMPVITHHQAVGILIGANLPDLMIEITGERGKTTTAYALAHLMQGRGILHTSSGTVQYPGRVLLSKTSITPASLIAPAREAKKINGWFIAESSLGVSGRGDLGILTTASDYRIANGKRSALAAKCEHVKTCKTLLLPGDIGLDHPNQHTVGEIVSCEGTTLSYDHNGICGSFVHPLLTLKGYRYPLMTAAAAACLLGIDPHPLSSFEALPGRMQVREEDGCLIIDASNSGTNCETSCEAAAYGRAIRPDTPIHLVIGQDEHAVCENFAESEIIRAIEEIRPEIVTIVSLPGPAETTAGYPDCRVATSLHDAIQKSEKRPDTILLLAVKTWR
ncbi:MAG: coenzyme F430 synthase [Methanocalculus sp.]|uniref:coenzyme F430 synthase n=1 Tax=Methanocalculus sp. TaxID=2004547 RepID=UPI002718AED9|nr:coenzyme F430 synthase [Methanocalculus sp.]MDO9540446.1 coenzyme F430 synthase [Methanocalculus sp.]